MYRACSCFWEIISKDYTNRNLWNTAYEALVGKCKELKPDADKQYVSKKISSLRASFRRQLRKIQDARTSTGSAAEDVPEPTFWYYELLKFTLGQEKVRPGISSRKSRENSENEPSEDIEASDEKDESECTVQHAEVELLHNPSCYVVQQQLQASYPVQLSSQLVHNEYPTVISYAGSSQNYLPPSSNHDAQNQYVSDVLKIVSPSHHQTQRAMNSTSNKHAQAQNPTVYHNSQTSPNEHDSAVFNEFLRFPNNVDTGTNQQDQQSRYTVRVGFLQTSEPFRTCVVTVEPVGLGARIGAADRLAFE
ncbi:hypothetical protein PR048_002964 [Dryococelus australis]|uniref:MADF domain-containing protein n=1 Tax=Dryococelus australis TaxID=614101 RepID=A0ABQ9ILN7_9NEOP|nr:hypothetical protein PR048_002964 [Dryococelus australis]